MRKDWEVKKLGDVCEIFDSLRKPITKSKRISGNYPYYGASGVQDYIDSFIFDGRYLLVGEDGAKWGKKETSSYIIEGKSWVNNHVHVLRLNECLIDSFVEYYLNYSDLNKYITGAVVPKLTQRALQSIIIPVPLLQTQYQIVEELDCLTSIIEKQKKQLEELNNLAQSIFYDMFGDPIENEKGWEMNTVSNISIKMSTGPFGSMLHKSDYTVDGIPTINPQNINNQNITTNDISKVSYQKAEELSKYIVRENNIIIARRGDLKKCAIVTDKEDGWLCGTGSFMLELKDIFPILFYYQYTSQSIQKYLNDKCIGATMPNLNQKILGGLKVIVPPLSLQQQFASKIEAIEKQKELIKKSIKETEGLFNSRMDYYFN